MKNNQARWIVAAALLFAAAGCIVSDQIITITIQPDGSADWVRFQSGVRSTEKGERGEEELRRFVEAFEARRDSDLEHLRASGGEITDTRWVRRQEPYAAVSSGRLPDAAALEKFCSLRDDAGATLVQARFSRDGSKRRLELAVRLPKNHPLVEAPRPSESQRRAEQANGLSETRFAVSGGRITGSRGFTIAEDKRSALLEIPEIQDILRAGEGKADLHLEWEIGDR